MNVAWGKRNAKPFSSECECWSRDCKEILDENRWQHITLLLIDFLHSHCIFNLQFAALWLHNRPFAPLFADHCFYNPGNPIMHFYLPWQYHNSLKVFRTFKSTKIQINFCHEPMTTAAKFRLISVMSPWLQQQTSNKK